ncbi:hypothetical protein Mgra_00007208 [Meloidogyne graminicola]|uniref:ATPase_AAA_core domain-containing protein n=1 Tax=Meloidogyne graminicola TaxID=189291 RepID=A0A8S9ZJ88_9BILA|nr:hypothetical protein Mgra_00007208 [Meloidogyne graminicola]
MKRLMLDLFLLTFLWCFLDIYGINSLLPSNIPKFPLKHKTIKLPNFKQNNKRVLFSSGSNSQLKEEKETEINKKMLDSQLKPITPLIVQKEEEKGQKEAKKRYANILKFLKNQIQRKRALRPKFKRAYQADFNNGKIFVTQSAGYVTEEDIEKIVFDLFENLPESLQTKKVAKQAVNMVLVLDEVERVLEYETAIYEIEKALEEEITNKSLENEIIDEGNNIAEEENNEEEEVEEEKINLDAWRNGKGSLNQFWLKLILFGILNISGPKDEIDERLIQSFERLNKANIFIFLLNENNEYRMELENGY